MLGVLGDLDQYDVIGVVDSDPENFGPAGISGSERLRAEVLEDECSLSDLAASRGVSMIVAAVVEPREDVFRR